MKFLLLPVLLLPVIVSAPAIAIEQQGNFFTANQAPSNQVAARASYNKLSNDLSKIEVNGVEFKLKSCQRDGEDVICNLQLTNIASEEQNISLFADCSRVIIKNKEFGGFNAQIGQGSSVALNAGVTRQGFITFKGIASSIDKLEVLEIAYSTTDGDGTIKFSGVDIK
jgi:hypothetical protein